MTTAEGRIGVVVNPVAGLGGPAGLKGSDGPSVQERAVARGSRPRATERAVAALTRVAASLPDLEVLTAAGSMGADAVAAAGLQPRVVWAPSGQGGVAVTTGADTSAAVRALVTAGAGLILFVGGDGTARDVAAGLGPRSANAVLGVPAGVKMYSGCFAIGPAAAGALATAWLSRDGTVHTEEREVLDVDEEQVRTGRVDPRLCGLVRVPVQPGRTQARKAPSPASEADAVRAAARGAFAALEPGMTYLLGPGGTMREVARALGVEGTPLGVDVVRDGRLLLADADETALLGAVDGVAARAVVGVIGGQGFLLGRGNQQLSAAVLATTAAPIVVATEAKLAALDGRPLLVDTGSPELDARLSGHVRVITGERTISIYPVRPADAVTADHTEGVSTCA